MNHMLHKALGAPLEALYGSEISLPPLPKRRKVQDDDIKEIPDVLECEKACLKSQFIVNYDLGKPSSGRHANSIHLICQLEDPCLPAVPPLPVIIPPNYPQTSPVCETELISIDYDGTPFLKKVYVALCCRLTNMPSRFTLSQLLSAWEMSVRSACSPKSNPIATEKIPIRPVA